MQIRIFTMNIEFTVHEFSISVLCILIHLILVFLNFCTSGDWKQLLLVSIWLIIYCAATGSGIVTIKLTFFIKFLPIFLQFFLFIRDRGFHCLLWYPFG